MSIVFVKIRFQYLNHSLQKRMVYHSNLLLEAVIKLWQRDYPYSRIVDIINDSAIAQIFQRRHSCISSQKVSGNKFSWNHKKTGQPRSVRMPNLLRSTKAKIVTNHQKRLQWKSAGEAGVDKSSMNRIIKKDLIFLKNVTSKFGIFKIFMANKINTKYNLWKRNFKVLDFKSRRSLWGHAWCYKKYILLTFKGICINFSLELKKIILSHPVTSKQPPEIVQIHMRHPVYKNSYP